MGLLDIPNTNLYGNSKKKRKPFSIKTKKIEWMRAGGHDSYEYIAHRKFVKTSKCRNPTCRRTLIWGDGSYDFDHKDNNPANNSQKNCWLVCKSCHGKHTKIGIRKERDALGFIRYKTIKKKIGYKKSRRKYKPRKRRKSSGNYWSNPLTGRKEKVQPMIKW